MFYHVAVKSPCMYWLREVLYFSKKKEKSKAQTIIYNLKRLAVPIDVYAIMPFGGKQMLAFLSSKS